MDKNIFNDLYEKSIKFERAEAIAKHIYYRVDPEHRGYLEFESVVNPDPNKKYDRK